MELNNIRAELKSRVAKGLNFGIEAMEDVLEPSSALFDDFILLKSKYNDLMYLSSINTMPEGKEEKIMAFLKDYFGNETGTMEVYFKNIKHLMAYAMESEIEQGFFLNTLKSLFSRYELAMIFYYSLTGIDPEFRALVRDSRLIDGSVGKLLLRDEHLSLL